MRILVSHQQPIYLLITVICIEAIYSISTLKRDTSNINSLMSDTCALLYRVTLEFNYVFNMKCPTYVFNIHLIHRIQCTNKQSAFEHKQVDFFTFI